MRLRASRSPRRTRVNEGFTLLELLVCIAIAATLICLTLPAIRMVQNRSQRAQCAHNLRQIGLGYQVFLDNHKGRTSAFKGNAEWVSAIKKYYGNSDEIYICGGDGNPSSSSHPAPGTAGASPLPMVVTHSDLPDFVMVVSSSPAGSLKIELALPSSEKPFIDKQPANQDPDARPTPASSTASSIQTSYGISAVAEYFGQSTDGQKVLAVEYHKSVVHVFGTAAYDFWPTDAAPRHQGMLNALYKNGSVQHWLQYEIDPRLTAIYTQFWQPEALRTE